MNTPLVPCPACQRHVRVSESDCPFCGAAIGERQGTGRVPVVTKRLGSLAVMAFRTAALGAAIAGCGGDDSSNPAADSGSDVGSGGSGSAGTGGTVGIGGAPTDNTGGSTGSGGTGGASGMGGASTGTGGSAPPLDGGPVPIYRATPRGP